MMSPMTPSSPPATKIDLDAMDRGSHSYGCSVHPKMPLGGLSGSDRESRHSNNPRWELVGPDYRLSDGPDCLGGLNFRYSAMYWWAWLLTV